MYFQRIKGFVEMITDINDIDFSKEFVFTASRSSGPGGQHVNKVNTRVELRFDIKESVFLSDDEKNTILTKLRNKITRDGILVIVSQSSRSQIKNKQKTIELFYKLINEALFQEKERIPAKPSLANKEKRIQEKKKISEKKSRRKNIDI